MTRIVRDQANKTLEIYLQRVRKHSQTLPDSMLPPPEAVAQNAPRMSTPQNDNSWTGWAISSFTNKLAAANGEIQPARNGLATPPTDRASSVPPTASLKTVQPALASRTARPSPVATPSAPVVPSVSLSRPESPVPNQEDFAGDWGDMEDEVADAWGDTEEASQPPLQPTPAVDNQSSTKSAFENDDEPDFAGWLDAQAKSKQKAKGPLPKGLSKPKPATTLVAPKSTTMGATAAARAAAKPAVVKAAVPKRTPVPTAQEDDEDWGDAWG